MTQEDLVWLCRTIGDLTGVPVRLFKEQEKIYFHSLVPLCRDPFSLYEEKILAIREHISYFITPDFSYYGIVNSLKYRLVIGPSRQVSMDSHELRELAFRLDVPTEEESGFISSMQGIVSFPLDSLMQTLCSVNFALNHEKRELSDLVLVDGEQEELHRQFVKQYSSEDFQLSPSDTYQGKSRGDDFTHNSLKVEEQLMKIIQNGNTAALREWVSQAPAIRPGIVAGSMLRQYKNIFIVTATLSSRAAIKGGLSEDTAFRLSDAYIQKCELLSDALPIFNLQYHMVMDYTERVERIRIGDHPSELVLKVTNYVAEHIYEHIRIEDVADHLYISKSHLFSRFKADTGQTLGDYILREKTEEAKRLLAFTDKPFSAISALLSFSSQSHFTRVFKKYAGMTPGEYRDQRKDLSNENHSD